MSPPRPMLLPLNPLYRAGLALRELRLRTGLEPVRRLRWPVVSVGSLSAGGSGKTPMTIALARMLSARGFHVDVLSRGYGRKSREAVRVRPDGTADEFGDEPLLIAQKAGVPVYVAAQRFEAGSLVESAAESEEMPPGRPVLHLLDDGFQHRQLHRDIDILLVSRGDWHDRLLPAGSLREDRGAAKRAQVLAIPADDPGFAEELRVFGWSGQVWRLRREMEVPAVNGAVAAFCGIAKAEQFFDGLAAKGLHIAAKIAFRDHHRYSPKDRDAIVATARKSGASALITTEKDRVRIGEMASTIPGSLPLLTAGLRIDFEDDAIEELVARLVERGLTVSPPRERAPS